MNLVIYGAEGIRTDRGRAVLTEISRSGAKLDQVQLPKGSLPLDGFALGIRLSDGALGELRGRLSRLIWAGRGICIGVTFQHHLPDSFLSRLQGFGSSSVVGKESISRSLSTSLV